MPEPLFNLDAFATYIDAFNRDDFEGYGRYYAPAVRMNYNGRVRLEGQDAIRRFYARVHRRVKQSINILDAVCGSDVPFADIEGKFLAPEDAPNFSIGPLAKGQYMPSRSLARCDLKAGLIMSVTTARYALEPG